MKTVLLHITMLLFAALLSVVTAAIGKDWVILLTGGFAVLVLAGMSVFIKDK
ncbi:hypothetical protein [Pseudoflavonifractor sp. 60]|uniref:hypothetical protein n=1 Tax=Pseudoflavonifractor sp. 60 TaxID=2304576 RepID=UPI0013713CCA|nr:hypothetical protein [Pseudoflavonifractor sp. 60]